MFSYRFSLPRVFAVLCTVLLLATGGFAQTKEGVLHRFNTPGDGTGPYAALITDSAGNLYGTTATGGGRGSCPGNNGPTGCGTVFELSPPSQSGGSWTETILYSFSGGADGADPLGGLIFNSQGNLYGAAARGGLQSPNCMLGPNSVGCGVVYELSPPSGQGGAWTESVLYSFTGSSDGASPEANLSFDAAGNVYSTTAAGGDLSCSVGTDNNAPGCGTVFELAPPSNGGAWTETVLHAFHGGTDGALPFGGSLLMDSKGALYGTTNNGGGYSTCTYMCGTIFKLSPPSAQGGLWTEAVLYVFHGGFPNNDGFSPNGGLVFSHNALYGTTQYGGGTSGSGTVFELSASGGVLTETVIYIFDTLPGTGGVGPWTTVVADTTGNLYGTTQIGGLVSCDGGLGCGVVYKLVPPTPGGAWTEDVLYSFKGGSDGDEPLGGVTLGKNILYGITTAGGGGGMSCTLFDVPGCGTVFALKP